MELRRPHLLCRGRRHERAYGQNPYWFRGTRLNFADNVLLSANENDHSVYYARFPHVRDESVLLFLKMKDGERSTDGQVERVKRIIGEERSKRHVPRYVFEAWDIPVSISVWTKVTMANVLQATVNVKKVELPVKQIVSGKIIKPSGTLANPQSLQFCYQFSKVEEVLHSMKKEKEGKKKTKL